MKTLLALTLLTQLPTDRSIMESHVRIHVHESPTAVGKASGVIVKVDGGQSKILSAGHCYPLGVNQKVTIDDGTGYWTGVPVRVLYVSNTQDLALLSASKLPKSVSSVAPLGHTINGELKAVGCPKGTPPVINRTRFRQWYTDSNFNDSRYFSVNGAFTFGRSGGGLYDSRGYLVGIQSATNFGTKETFFVDITRSRGFVSMVRSGGLGVGVVQRSLPRRSQPRSTPRIIRSWRRAPKDCAT